MNPFVLGHTDQQVRELKHNKHEYHRFSYYTFYTHIKNRQYNGDATSTLPTLIDTASVVR